MNANATIRRLTGCYSVIAANGALVGRFERKADAAEAAAKGTPEGNIRQAIISELDLTGQIEISDVNAYSAAELADWAEILGL